VDSAAGSGDWIANSDLRMLHIFLSGRVGVAWRFAERVLEVLATVECWLASGVPADRAFYDLVKRWRVYFITTLALV
jgi:hypothetical protein